MNDGRVLICVAVEEEAAAVREALQARGGTIEGRRWEGQIAAVPLTIDVEITGQMNRTAERATAKALRAGYEIAVFAGTAGGLREDDAKIGDVALPKVVRSTNNQTTRPGGRVDIVWSDQGRADGPLFEIAEQALTHSGWAPSGTSPKVHLRDIASGDVKHEDVSNPLVTVMRKQGLVAVEREGFGFLTAADEARPPVPAVVVRSIMDFLGDRKDGDVKNRNQRTAARVAAAAALAVVEQHVRVTRTVGTNPERVRRTVAKLAARDSARTEADVQSQVRQLLIDGGLNLVGNQLQDIHLEAPVGGQRRIDVEVGRTVIEVKKDLRVGNVRADAVGQLAGYVKERTARYGTRYVGVLTDGAEWTAHLLVGDRLQLASTLSNRGEAGDAERLTVWLEGILSTAPAVRPTPEEIVRRLGAGSPAHELDRRELAELYARHRDVPSVRLKRQLWAKLLTTALGTAFTDEDDLFVEHTLLVLSAEVIAHAAIGVDPTAEDLTPAGLVTGEAFAQRQISGVVEADFFDWTVETPDGAGDRFVAGLARRLSRFAWAEVEHDVMKVLYESVIGAGTRHALGEYYTPDWLAGEVVHQAVTAPLEQRVLDPACGSGTFLFQAVRRYLDAAEDAGVPGPAALTGVTAHVLGVDVHPVAVTLARVTYLLALGRRWLDADDRPPLRIPVYLGDSIQWGQQSDLLSTAALVVPTDTGLQTGGQTPLEFPAGTSLGPGAELRFPRRLLADPEVFDRLVARLSDLATDRDRGTKPPGVAKVLQQMGVQPDDRQTVTDTFTTMCRLHDDGRNHIWGYYVRNLARPLWLADPDNHVDVLVGNPPWLSYRYMTPTMQETFQRLSAERGLWHGSAVATHQDLSALFLARSVELYLRPEGRFGFVMPLAALSRQQFAGMRQGDLSPRGVDGAVRETVHVAYETPWDLHAVKPSFFPVPASVIFGRRTAGDTAALDRPAEMWSGRLPAVNLDRPAAGHHLTREPGTAGGALDGAGSPYASRFAQGATVVPRVLFVVEPAPGVNAGAGRRAVRSARSAKEKPPWKRLPGLSETVEQQFVRPLYVGDSVLPYRTREPHEAVVPWDGEQLLGGDHEDLPLYPGLRKWWQAAEKRWKDNRSSERLELVGQLDFRRKFVQQFPAPEHRVVYSASGMYLAAARVSDATAVIEHKLYWGRADSADEARYLCAVFNSSVLTQLVRPLQGRGEHNPRDFDKYIFRLPIPTFDPADRLHTELAALASRAEELAAGVPLPDGKNFTKLRGLVRAAVATSAVGHAIEAAVSILLLPPEVGQEQPVAAASHDHLPADVPVPPGPVGGGLLQPSAGGARS